jgi:hypothetical protein
MTHLLKSLLKLDLLALVAFTAAVTPQALRADNAVGCAGNSVMNGTYVMSATGTVVGVGPVAVVGVVTYDGQGNGSATSTQSVNGTIYKGVAATATFTVNRDCTGSKTFSDGSQYDFVITLDGSTITWIETDPGVVVSGTAVRIKR